MKRLGILAALTLPLILIACRGVLGIHELTYDGGAEDAHVHDATTDSSQEAGEDAGEDASAKDGGTDSGHDAGHDAGRDAGVDAGHDSGHDSGHDAGASQDACINACLMGSSETMAFLNAFSNSPCQCSQCTTCTGGMRCTPPPPPETGAPPTTCPACIAKIVASGGCNAVETACPAGNPSCGELVACIMGCH